jgi:hypothetical protein
MNLYQRVALSDPQGAKNIIKSYGYEIRTNNLPAALRMLVSAEGEPALRSIVALHPDKDLILECFSDTSKPQKKDSDCDCHKNKAHDYLNATGQMTEAQKQAQLTNTFLVVSAVLILGALIIKNS